MKKQSWLFKRLDLSLRSEVIIDISLLMLAAIFLIGFTTSKVNEENIIQEKIRNGKGMIQDFQTIIDFMLRDKKDLPLSHTLLKKEIQNFAQIYITEKGLYHLIITDPYQKVIASQEKELWDKDYQNPLLKQSIQSGLPNTEIEKYGSFLLPEYKKLVLYSPLWSQGKIVGGVQMEVLLEDVMRRLMDSQRMILILISLDAMVLIVFGSFLLSRVLVKPLKDLVRLTQKISQGDFSQKIEVTSKNEIGQLIASFNRMIEQLREGQENIKGHLESLELANRKLKQAQEELIRTEKLASIGKFAAGVAHEVGNPLGSILGYTTILGKEGICREEAKDYLNRIEREIERINRIVQDLLNFARPSKFEIHDVEINQVIENTLSLLSYQKNFKNIQTQIDLQSNLPLIKGDESQLSQVFINIILNAIDAMPNGGMLKLKTEEYMVKKSLPQFHIPRRKDDPLETDYSYLRNPDPLSVLFTPLESPSIYDGEKAQSFLTGFTKFSKRNRLIKISISDTGIGIKDEDLEKIFDPFFTTKDFNKGTGLGLSISLRIVESLGGEIKVESQVGKGTTFEIYFPAA
jgi:signal transduction histidine kinase